jgi:hypothetical protein
MNKQNLTDEQTDYHANEFLNWGEGAWGTCNLYWSNESQKAIWQRIAEIAQERAESYTE